MDQTLDSTIGAELTEADVRRSVLYLHVTTQGAEGVIAEGGARPVIHRHLSVDGREALQRFLLGRTLARPFARTVLFIDEDLHYTLVPQDFTRGGVTPGQWLTDLPEGHCLQSVVVSDLGIDIVFTTTEETYDRCQSAFHEPIYSHPIAPLTVAGAIYSRRTYPRTLLAAISEGHADLCFFEQGRLLLANRYTVTDPVDLLYYITSTWEHFRLDREQDHLLLYTPEERPAAMELLSDAVTHVRVNDYSALTSHPEDYASILSPTLRMALICE